MVIMKPEFRELKPAPEGQRSFRMFEINMTCPHCDCFSVAKGVYVGAQYETFLVECLQCHKCTALFVNNPNNQPLIQPDMITDYYPKTKVTVDPFVPAEIAKDYLEAKRCFSVGAWQACCVMARRCIHHIVEKFHAEGADLPKQIEDLKTKDLASSLLVKTAHKIRVLGKHGAHPFDFKGESLAELTMEDAAAAVEFCDFIFNELFIHPGKLNSIGSDSQPPNE